MKLIKKLLYFILMLYIINCKSVNKAMTHHLIKPNFKYDCKFENKEKTLSLNRFKVSEFTNCSGSICKYRDRIDRGQHFLQAENEYQEGVDDTYLGIANILLLPAEVKAGLKWKFSDFSVELSFTKEPVSYHDDPRYKLGNGRHIKSVYGKEIDRVSGKIGIFEFMDAPVIEFTKIELTGRKDSEKFPCK